MHHVARDLDIVVNCDVCAQRAAHVGLTVALGGRPAREIDLCVEHYRALVVPLLEVLALRGVMPGRAAGRDNRQSVRRREGPYVCAFHCGASQFKNGTTLISHLRGIHGMSLPAYVARFGPLVPLAPGEVYDIEVLCPVPGCPTVYSTGLGHRKPQQALMSHMWGHHGIKWRPSDDAERA